jgi:HlyD family secretion protein
VTVNQINRKQLLKRMLLVTAVVFILGITGWLLRPLPKVEVSHPRKMDITELVIASGKVRVLRQSEIGTEVSGVVERVSVDIGDWVKQGQPLIHLVRRDAERQLDQANATIQTAQADLARIRRGALPEEVGRARAELDNARSVRAKAELDFRRARDLVSQGVEATLTLDQAQAALEQAQAAESAASESLQLLLKQPFKEELRLSEAKLKESESSFPLAQEMLRKRTLLAPFDGLVTKREVEPGQSVVAGRSLLTLANMATLEIYVETDENNLARLRNGQTATIIPPAYKNQAFKAVLFQIGPEVDNARGVVGLRLRPESLPEYVRPDMTVDVNIEVERYPGMLGIPASSVISDGGKHYVHVLQGKRVIRIEVEIRGQGIDWVGVTNLPEDMWVVNHATEVTPGQTVRVEEL